LQNAGPVAWLLLFALITIWTARRWRFGLRFQAAAFMALVLAQGGMAAVEACSSCREHCTLHGRDLAFAKEFLRTRQTPVTPTIYSCLGRLDLVWLDLHAKSYFDWWQMGGVMYQRTLAVEGQRRALVVGPFEIDRFRILGQVPEDKRELMNR